MLLCYTELYKKLFYFNFNVDLINQILKYGLKKQKKIREVFDGFVKHILTDNNPNLYKTKL